MGSKYLYFYYLKFALFLFCPTVFFKFYLLFFLTSFDG